MNRERKIEDAVRILSHYFAQGGSGVDRESLQDLHAEMRDVVTSIVDAAVATVLEIEARK